MNRKNQISKANLYSKIIALNFYFFLIVFGLGVISSLLEVYKYKGFIAKHFLLGTDLFFYASLISGLIVLLNFELVDELRWKLNYWYDKALNINIWVLFGLGFFYIYFNTIEEKKGLNYVFSTYHLQPDNIINIFQFSFLLIIILLMSKINTAKTD